jgi:NAD(P)-dependent dehydrogenase (short-subunit alcohol dehydrogenase family)
MSALASRHALVTGGGSGIGAAIARELAGAGARVTITGRRRDLIEEVAGTQAGILPIVADATDESATAEAFRQASEANGPISIVVANAGAAESAPFTRTGLDLFDRMLAVNLRGVFLTLREGARAMQGSDWGRLVVIASTAGLKGYPYVSSYCAAKHGAIGLVRAVAAETAGTGVTANAVCPGYAETPMLEQSVDTIVGKTGRTADETREHLASYSPLRRFIRPEEVAATVLWLCGPGSDAVTGQAISVSGGETW